MLTTCTVVDLTQCWQECKVTKVYKLAAELEIDTNVKIHIYIIIYLLTLQLNTLVYKGFNLVCHEIVY